MWLGRNFFFFFVGTVLSSAGTAMVPVALSFAILYSGRSPTFLGVILAAQTIPTVVFLLAGGVIGDRWPRRRVMIGADALRCVTQIILAMYLVGGRSSLLPLAAMSALIGLGNAFFLPASGRLVVEIISPKLIIKANSILRLANAVALVLGPASAGVLVVWIGAGWVIGLDGVSYALSALCLLCIKVQPAVRPPAPYARRPVLHDFLEGLGAFSQRRWLWLVVGQFGLVNLFAAAPLLVIGPVMLAKLPNGVTAWGLLLSAIGVGGACGTIAIMRVRPRRPLVVMEVAVGLIVVPLFLLAFRVALPLVQISGVCFGFGAAVLNILLMTIIQQQVPQAVLSRVMSIVQLAAIALVPVGYALAGPGALWLGPNLALGTGAFCVALSILVLLSQKEIRDFGIAQDNEISAQPTALR